MLTIKSDLFRRYNGILSKSVKSTGGTAEYMYLDPKKGYAYFENRPTYQGRLKMETEGEVCEPFWVHTPTFLSLINEYPEITYDADKGTFSYNGEVFRVSTLDETFNAIDFDSVHNNTEYNQYTIDEDSLAVINDAFRFTGGDDIAGRNYNGVMLFSDSVVATNGFDLYEAQTGSSVSDEEPLLLSGDLQSLFSELQDGDVDVYVGGSAVFIENDAGDIMVYTPQVGNLHYPPIWDEDFCSRYTHDTAIVVSKKELVDVLKFMKSFTKGSKYGGGSYVELEASSGEDKVLSIVSTGDDSQANRKLYYESCDMEILDAPFKLHRESLYNGAMLVDEDNVRIEVDMNANAIRITKEGMRDKQYLATARVQDD